MPTVDICIAPMWPHAVENVEQHTVLNPMTYSTTHDAHFPDFDKKIIRTHLSKEIEKGNTQFDVKRKITDKKCDMNRFSNCPESKAGVQYAKELKKSGCTPAMQKICSKPELKKSSMCKNLNCP